MPPSSESELWWKEFHATVQLPGFSPPFPVPIFCSLLNFSLLKRGKFLLKPAPVSLWLQMCQWLPLAFRILVLYHALLLSSPLTFILDIPVATQASLPFLCQVCHTPASGVLYLLFSLHGFLFPQKYIHARYPPLVQVFDQTSLSYWYLFWVPPFKWAASEPFVPFSCFSLLHRTYPSDISYTLLFNICLASKLHEGKYFVYLFHCDIPEPKVGTGE